MVLKLGVGLVGVRQVTLEVEWDGGWALGRACEDLQSWAAWGRLAGAGKHPRKARSRGQPRGAAVRASPAALPVNCHACLACCTASSLWLTCILAIWVSSIWHRVSSSALARSSEGTSVL